MRTRHRHDGADADQMEIERKFQHRVASPRKSLVIACGALAREIVALSRGPLGDFDVSCLPAQLHNRPERIPEAIRRKIRENRARYDEILVLYGDCGTGGALDVDARRRERGPRRRAALLRLLCRRGCDRGDDGRRARFVLCHRLPRPAFRSPGHPWPRPRPFPRAAQRLLRRLQAARLSRPDRRPRPDRASGSGGRAARPRFRTPLHRAQGVADSLATARRAYGSGKSRCRQAPRSERRSGAPASSGATK